eukprot:SAG31_NODE_47656_length_229_cov_26.300000_1_plen_38_part_10
MTWTKVKGKRQLKPHVQEVRKMTSKEFKAVRKALVGLA